MKFSRPNNTTPFFGKIDELLNINFLVPVIWPVTGEWIFRHQNMKIRNLKGNGGNSFVYHMISVDSNKKFLINFSTRIKIVLYKNVLPYFTISHFSVFFQHFIGASIEHNAFIIGERSLMY